MKIASHSKQLFVADVKERLRCREWNLAKLAEMTGVHQSQVSRIVSGKFKTWGSNVMKICMILDMESSSYCGRYRVDDDRKAIADSAIAIWDGSHRDAGIVVSLLKEIAKLRRNAIR